jgi:hypothetical protein
MTTAEEAGTALIDCHPDTVHAISSPKDVESSKVIRIQVRLVKMVGVTSKVSIHFLSRGVHAATLTTARRGFCDGNAYSKAQTNVGTAYGAD